MADHIDQAIQAACAEIDRLAADLHRKKLGVNSFCETLGRPPVYQDVTSPETARANSSQGRSDRYLNKPLATVLKLILTARHTADIGPATTDELYAEMASGGYDFGGKSDDDAKRGLAVSMTKNSRIFYKLPNGKQWGLAEWYGIKPGRAATQRTLTNGEGTGEGDVPDVEMKNREFGEADRQAEVPAKG